MRISYNSPWRWFGLAVLSGACLMLFVGQTVLKSVLHGWWFLGYWLVCFALTGLAMLTALADFWIVRQRSRRAQHDLIQESLRPLRPEERIPPARKRHKPE